MSHYLLEESLTEQADAVHDVLLPAEDVHRRADDAQHPRDARGCVHRRLSRRGARVQHPGPEGHGGANHGHRVRPPYPRARRRARAWRAKTAARSSRSPASRRSAESVDPPNNNGYERTLLLTNIGQAVEALLPFAEKTAAEKAGFDTTKPYKFVPFTPTLPNPLGEFHSLKG